CSPLQHRPPPSPPFPYTTLFRSRHLRDGPAHQMTLAPVGHDAIQPSAEPRRLPAACEVTVGADEALGHGVRGGVQAPEHPGGEPDRKSTRLNSSHVSISSAVFCL